MQVRPTLISWAEHSLKHLYAAASQVDFDDAIDAFLSENCDFTLNGKRRSRDEYKSYLKAEKSDETWCQMQFRDASEKPLDFSHPREAGSVDITFEALLNIQPKDGDTLNIHPEHRDISTTIRMVILQDDSARSDHLPCRGACCDYRRVCKLEEITSNVVKPGFVPHNDSPASSPKSPYKEFL